jgi:hypothetical protein
MQRVMRTTGYLAAAAGIGRLLVGGLLIVAGSGVGSAQASDGVTLDASYIIAISGLTIGRADVKGRFNEHGYAAAISGSTYGVSRLVSDAQATLAGAGRVVGNNVVPASYNLTTSESGFETSVNMTMRGGAVVGLQAIPSLPEAPDRVPITPASKQNVVDPVGAFVIALDRPGDPDPNFVCNRTVRVFDGWKRFDVHLSYKESKAVDDGSEAYSGETIICAARYLPVAGHRTSDDSVTFMADNKRIEITLARVKGTNYMVPYTILIGTKLGDLTISARTFQSSGGQQQASAD